MIIRKDDLEGTEIRALLQSHLADAYKNSPPENVHALDIIGLQKPDITFWSVWEDGVLLGCAALKELSPNHGEIKSMRTSKAALKRGVASKLMTHILEQARLRKYARLSLETGSNRPYFPALALYKKFGFTECPPFADYWEAEFSIYMTLAL